MGTLSGLREQAGDTLMDLGPASHNHFPGHLRTERKETKRWPEDIERQSGETEEGELGDETV